MCVCVCVNLCFFLKSCIYFCCCPWAFSNCGEQGLLPSRGAGLLLAVASLVAEHGLYDAQASTVAALGLSSCGSWAQLPCGMWNLPGPGIESVSPALAGGFLSTGPPGKPTLWF